MELYAILSQWRICTFPRDLQQLGPLGAGLWSSWLPISILPIPFSEPANLTSLLLCGMYIAYQQPVEYNLAVAREALKHVHTTQRLQPPTSFGVVLGTYGTLRARTRLLGYWCEVVRSGEYTCLGVTLSRRMAFFKCVSFLYVSFSSLPLRAWSDRVTARSSSTFSYQPRTSIRTSSFQEVTYCKVCTRRVTSTPESSNPDHVMTPEQRLDPPLYFSFYLFECSRPSRRLARFKSLSRSLRLPFAPSRTLRTWDQLSFHSSFLLSRTRKRRPTIYVTLLQLCHRDKEAKIFHMVFLVLNCS